LLKAAATPSIEKSQNIAPWIGSVKKEAFGEVKGCGLFIWSIY
jgi:hypothetical protein